ncbi:hypothetical protein pb186bvf_019940 [Paramecium bursaria]
MQFQKGINYLKQKEYELALNCFQQDENKQEKDQGYQLYQGNFQNHQIAICLYKLKKYEQSLKIIKKINDRRFLDMAQVYLLKLHLKLKIEIDPKGFIGLDHSAQFHYSLGRYLLSDQIEARKQFDLAIQKQPNYYKAELYRCLTYNNHGPVLELAKLVRKYPCEQKGYLFIICKFFENQEYEQVLLSYDQAIQLGPVPYYIHDMQIESLIQVKKYKEAKNILKQIGTSDLRIGICLVHLGQLNKAIDFYKDNDDKESIFYYADCLFLKEEYNDALEIYKQGKIAIQIFKISVILRNYDIAKDVLNLMAQVNSKPSKLFNDNFDELIRSKQQISESLDKNIDPEDIISQLQFIQFKIEELSENHSHISDHQRSYSSYHSQKFQEIQVKQIDFLELLSQHSIQLSHKLEEDKQMKNYEEQIVIIKQEISQLEETKNGMKQLVYLKGFCWVLVNYFQTYSNFQNGFISMDYDELVEGHSEQNTYLALKTWNGLPQINQSAQFVGSSFSFIEKTLNFVFQSKMKMKITFMQRRNKINSITKCLSDQDLEILITKAGLQLSNYKLKDILTQKQVKDKLSDYVLTQRLQLKQQNNLFDSFEAMLGITDAIYILYKFYDECNIAKSQDTLDQLIINYIVFKPQNESNSEIIKIEQVKTPTKDLPRDSCGCIIQ